jgi:DNA excision repair protein ERCC-4
MSKRTAELPVLLVDTREQRPLRFSDLVRTERATLPTGDYSAAGLTARVAIERKSLPDLVACCGPGRDRFLDCCRRLRDYELGAVVVEASVNDVLAHAYRSRMHPQSVLGTTIAILADYGISTIWAGDEHNAASIVERLLVRMLAKREPEEAA